MADKGVAGGAERKRWLKAVVLAACLLGLGLAAGSTPVGAYPVGPAADARGGSPEAHYLYNIAAPAGGDASRDGETDGEHQGYLANRGSSGPSGATPTSTPCVPTNPTWTPVPTMPPPARYNTYGAVGADGRFYVPGGLMQDPTPVPNFYAFNPPDNTWATLAPLPTPRSNSAVGALGGKIHVAGGFLGPVTPPRVVPVHHEYDIASNTWTERAAVPAALASSMGWGFAGNNRFYLFGGVDENFTYSLATYIYDPVANSWTTGAPMPGYKEAGGIAGWADKIYLFGGRNELGVVVNTLWEYNPAANTWAVRAPAPVNRYWPGMSARDGKLYVTGGGPSEGNPYEPSNQVYIYDIASNTWGTGPNLRTERTSHVQGTLPDGRIIAAGGVSTALQNTLSAEVLPMGVTCAGTPTVTVTVTPTRTPTATPTLCPINFSDVGASDWFYEFVQCLYCRGAISGYADGTFRPFNNTTRGQMTKIVVLAFEYPNYTPPQPSFTDVPTTDAFYEYIETAAHNNIVSGYSDGTFRPYNQVTRGQLSKIVVVAAGWALLSPPTPHFSDVPPGSAFFEFVETAYCHQIITGYTDGTFRPGNNATRAQISKIVCLAVRDAGSCPSAILISGTTESPANRR